MEKIVGLVEGIPKTRAKNDDDFLDRLSSRYTVVMIVVFAVVITAHQYVGGAITCWVPVHFTGSHTAYTNSYCWVRNTYYLPYDDDVPEEYERRQTIPYYQWIPFILLGQAILFYVPSVVWNGLNQKSGVDADNILASANTFNSTEKAENREKMLKLICNQMDRFLGARKTAQTGIKSYVCGCSTRLGSYLVILYLVTKLLYIANVVGQLFLLNAILATRYNVYGIEVLEDMVGDHNWMDRKSVAFPRVTMCDFKVRRLGNIHRYTVQCVLPINMYTEKIYIFLWFWMVFVAFLTVLGFLQWLLRAILSSDRIKFIKNHLKLGGKLEDINDENLVDQFTTQYLKQDGAFLLRLIVHNTNNITATEIICAMWDLWMERRNRLKHGADSDDEDDDDIDDETPLKSDPATEKAKEAGEDLPAKSV